MTLSKDHLTPTPETGFEPPDIWAWSQTAKTGDCLTYWEGNLAEACEREIQAEKQGETKSIARDVRRDAWNLYERGAAILYQRRIGPFVKSYLLGAAAVIAPDYSRCTIYDAERLGHDDARLGQPPTANPFDDWFRGCAYAYGHAAALDVLCAELVEQAQLAGVPRSFRPAQEVG